MDDDKPSLKVLKPPKAGLTNKFWSCCPLFKAYLPESACSKGQPELENGKVKDEPSCPWWINSAEHNFCFWRYVKAKSNSEGVMKELVQSELAGLFGWSHTKMHFMLKQAVVELTDALKLHGAAELLKDMDFDDVEGVVLESFYLEQAEDPIE